LRPARRHRRGSAVAPRPRGTAPRRAGGDIRRGSRAERSRLHRRENRQRGGGGDQRAACEQVYVDPIKRGEASPFVEEWLAFLSSSTDEATATLLIAVVRGLLLDRLATGAEERTDAALALAASVIAWP
jgi:hypothetical protein